MVNNPRSWILIAQSAIVPLLVLMWGGLLWVPVTVFGDGQVFPEIRVDPVVQIPDQQALLSFENGREQLVIETAFIGSGTNFAWVIPFPAEPEITAVSPAFFASLRSAFKPTLVHEVRSYWLAFLVAGLWIYLINRSLRDEVTWVNDLPWCLLVALAAGWSFKSAGIGLVLLFFLVLIRLLRTTQNLAIVSLTFLAAASIFPLVIPLQRGLIEPMALANGGPPSLESAVTIHNQQQAGIYETTTGSSRDAQAMQRWSKAVVKITSWG